MHELNFFGPDADFDHVGMVVVSIAQAAPGATPIADDRQRVSVAFVDFHGVRTELIEPLGDRSPVLQNLADGRPLAHLCFRVPDLEAAIQAGRRHGFHLLGRPQPAPAFGGRLIAWVFSRSYGLIELVASPG